MSAPRKLYHPAPQEITVEGILYALSDPVRAQIFMDLAQSDCAKNCRSFMSITQEQLPKSTLSHHFRVLREAGLIYSERKGVELHNRTRCEELRERFGGLIGAIVAAYGTPHK